MPPVSCALDRQISAPAEHARPASAAARLSKARRRQCCDPGRSPAPSASLRCPCPRSRTASGIIASALMICELRVIESEMEVGLARCGVGLAERLCGQPLVDQRDDQQQQRRATTMKPRCGWIRNIAKHEEAAPSARPEATAACPTSGNVRSCCKVAERLVFLARCCERGPGGSAEDRRAELRRDLDRGTHEDEAADRVEHRLQDDRADDRRSSA